MSAAFSFRQAAPNACHFVHHFTGEYNMNNNINMQACIDACSHCHQTCLHTAMIHCLVIGGKHVEANHFRLMINCAEICQASANFMLSGSDFHKKVCESVPRSARLAPRAARRSVAWKIASRFAANARRTVVKWLPPVLIRLN